MQILDLRLKSAELLPNRVSICKLKSNIPNLQWINVVNPVILVKIKQVPGTITSRGAWGNAGAPLFPAIDQREAGVVGREFLVHVI